MDQEQNNLITENNLNGENVDDNQENVPVSKTLREATEPTETEERFIQTLQEGYLEHGRFFKTREDSNYFTMLPISSQQKVEVLKRALELEKDTKEI